jgi:hypothetical protein
MIRKLIIHFITPIIWNKYSDRKSRAMLEFSTIEKDSGNQILWALNLIPDPEIKALLFQHVLEEYFHADLFGGLSELFSDTHLVKDVLEREILVDKNSSEKSVWEFFAYAHIGEEEVNRDFSYYTKVRTIDPKISSIFKKVSDDEGEHIIGTSEILFKLVNENKITYNWLIIKSKFKRTKKLIQRYTNHIGNTVLITSFSAIYFIIGFFTYKKIKARFNSISSKDIVTLLIEQQLEIRDT